MNTQSLTPVVGLTRVHPRRRRRTVTSDVAEVVDMPVVFSAPLEDSEVRRRFVDIYEQASRIAFRSE